LEAVKKAMVDSGAPDWYVEGQMEQFGVRLKGYQGAVTSTFADLIGRQPLSFDQFARDHAAVFRGDQIQPRTAAN